MTDPFNPQPPQAPLPQASPPQQAPAWTDQAPQPGAPAYGAPPPVHHGGYSSTGQYGAAPVVAIDAPYAGFGSRAIATLLDSLIHVLFAVPLVIIGISQWETRTTVCTQTDGTTSPCEVPTDRWFGIAAALAGAWLLIALLMIFFYFIRPISKKGNTIGGRVMGLQVLSSTTGQPPTLGRSALRFLMRAFGSSQFFGLGFWWMLWDSKNQTLHDKVGDTVVVRRKG